MSEWTEDASREEEDEIAELAKFEVALMVVLGTAFLWAVLNVIKKSAKGRQ